MPNEPKPAVVKRTPPRDRQNAQSDHEGSSHDPSEFDAQNPARVVDPVKDGGKKGGPTT